MMLLRPLTLSPALQSCCFQSGTQRCAGVQHVRGRVQEVEPGSKRVHLFWPTVAKPNQATRNSKTRTGHSEPPELPRLFGIHSKWAESFRENQSSGFREAALSLALSRSPLSKALTSSGIFKTSELQRAKTLKTQAANSSLYFEKAGRTLSPLRTGSTWIMKPIGRSQGSGIFLVSRGFI